MKKVRSSAPKASAPAAKRPVVEKRTRRSGDDLRVQIVRAATEEFKRAGYSGATTASIARRAETTEAQVFRYFGSKSNLFRETVFKPLDQHFLDFVSKHTTELERAGGSKEMTPLYTSELQRFIGSHSQMLMSLVVAQTYDPEAGGGDKSSLQAFFDHGASMMQKRLKGKPKVSPQVMVRLAFASVLGAVMFRDWIFPSGTTNDSALESAINAFVMEGIGANDHRE